MAWATSSQTKSCFLVALMTRRVPTKKPVNDRRRFQWPPQSPQDRPTVIRKRPWDQIRAITSLAAIWTGRRGLAILLRILLVHRLSPQMKVELSKCLYHLEATGVCTSCHVPSHDVAS